MNVQSVQSPWNIAYADRVARAYPQPAAAEQAQAAIDRVTISPQARAMNDEVALAVWQGDPPKAPAPGELPAIPSWMLNYDETLKRSEAGLKAAMRQLGIPADTHFSIKADNYDGTVTVEGNFPQRAELEALVNNNPALRNVLVATDGNAHLKRIVAESEKATAAADANPAGADRYYAWLIAVSRQISGMDFTMELKGGHLSGWLAGADGQPMGILDKLANPPA